MSQAEDDFIRVSCPQCNKRLKAPQKFAGDKINCPRCNAVVKLPSVASTKNDDDNWLALDDDIFGDAPSEPTKVAPKTTASPAASKQDKRLDSASNTKPQTAKASGAGAGASAKTDASLSVPVEDDDFKLSPVVETSQRASLIEETLANAAGTKTPAPKTPVSGKPPVKPAGSSPKPIGSAPKSGVPSGQRPVAGRESSVTNRSLLDEALPPLDDSEERISHVAGESPDIRVTCKICGTYTYKPRSMIGQVTECPDCFSKFRIPEPPAAPKKAPKIVLRDDADDVKLAPAVSTVNSEAESVSKVTQETLRRAKQELDDEEQEQQAVTFDFDTSTWLRRTFSFLMDPGALVIMLVFSVAIGAINFLAFKLDSWAEGGAPFLALLKILVRVGLLVPAFFFLLANGLAILEAAANKLKRVQEWPLFNMGEWMGEAMAPCVAMAFALVPAGALAAALQGAEFHPLISIASTLVIVWLVFPAVLLSILDNQSITAPISMPVLKSFSLRPDAWGALMMQTAVVSVLFFIVSGFAFSAKEAGGFILGAIIPFYIFFIFNQIGILAARIADVTALPFEPDVEEQPEGKPEDESAE